MKADRKAIDAALARLDPAIRLVLVYGPDDAGARALADQFTARLAPADDPMARVDLDRMTLAGDPARLADEAAAVSMFGDARLIRVDGAGDESAAAVDALLAAPAAGNPVVMTASALKPTSTLLKLALASPLALAHQCYAPEGRAAEAMVAEAAAARGLRPDHAALAALAANFAGERGVLGQELDKLALYLDAMPGDEVALDAEALAAVGAEMAESDFAGLVDAVAGGNPAATEAQAARLDLNGIAGVAQLRAVARRFWLLADLRGAIDAGRSARDAVEAARPPVFWKEKDAVARQAERWSTPVLKRVLAELLAAERRIKASGSAPTELLAGHTLIGIARLGARRR